MMASGYKSHKTELVAIYKLEFYRKQKNWKFAHETKKPVKTPRSKSHKIRSKTLNETYDIEPETRNESPLLNNGFLDDIPDKDTQYPQQTPVPANTLCEEPIHSLPWYGGQEYMEPERDDQKWWDLGQVYSEPAWPDPLSPPDYDDMWMGGAAAEPYDCVDAPAASQDMQMEELVKAIERCGTASDMLEDQPQGSPCVEADVSDSFAEFIRGAHLAPHSSETDLQLDTGVWCGFGWSPALLSARALASGVRSHAHTLAALLRETALRDRAKLSRSCCSEQLQPLPSDVQWHPQPLTRQETFTVSCTNIGTTGRGRGRLHRDHIIGIGMGRPYRLV